MFAMPRKSGTLGGVALSVVEYVIYITIYNVCGKRAPQVSERRTPPNLRTSPISTNNGST